MQVARTEAEHRRHTLAVTEPVAQPLQARLDRRLAGKVGQHPQVVAGLDEIEERANGSSRAGRRAHLVERGPREGQAQSVGAGIRGRNRQASGVRVLLQQRLGRVLGLLHVRLIERVDTEHGAGRRRRDLPAHELRADAQRLDQADEQPIVTVHRGPAERLAGNRHDPGPALAGRLCDELLDPQTEWPQPRSRDQRELVTPGARGAAQDDPERDTGILTDRVRRPAEARHPAPPAQQPADVQSHDRRRHHAEKGQRRVAAADV